MPKFELKLKQICIDHKYATIEIEADNAEAAVLKFYERTPDVEKALSDADWGDNYVVDTKYQMIDFNVVS